MAKTAAWRLVDYVDQNLELNLSVQELAAVVGMGLRQFYPYFPQTFGMTPHKYVLLRRVIKAQQWLVEQRPAAEIAHALGF
jgi:AraC family transcriptional regulator